MTTSQRRRLCRHILQGACLARYRARKGDLDCICFSCFKSSGGLKQKPCLEGAGDVTLLAPRERSCLGCGHDKPTETSAHNIACFSNAAASKFAFVQRGAERQSEIGVAAWAPTSLANE
jgi:hypothetical protein